MAHLQKQPVTTWGLRRLGVLPALHDRCAPLDTPDFSVLRAAAAAAAHAPAHMVQKQCAVAVPGLPRRRVQVHRVFYLRTPHTPLSPFLNCSISDVAYSGVSCEGYFLAGQAVDVALPFDLIISGACATALLFRFS